jgi:hypothetical protein
MSKLLEIQKPNEIDFHDIKTCRRKIRYSDPIKAFKRLIEIGANGSTDPLQTYVCKVCGGIHLGNKKVRYKGKLEKLSERRSLLKLIMRVGGR